MSAMSATLLVPDTQLDFWGYLRSVVAKPKPTSFGERDPEVDPASVVLAEARGADPVTMIGSVHQLDGLSTL
jgi:hypothetical protein